MVPCCTFFFCAEALSQPVSLPLCPSARRGISSLACSGKLVLVLFSVVKCWKLAELKITSNVASVQHNTPHLQMSHSRCIFKSSVWWNQCSGSSLALYAGNCCPRCLKKQQWPLGTARGVAQYTYNTWLMHCKRMTNLIGLFGDFEAALWFRLMQWV